MLLGLQGNLPSLGDVSEALDGGQGNPGSQLADTTDPLYCDNHRLSCPLPSGPLTAKKHCLIGEDISWLKYVIIGGYFALIDAIGYPV